MSFDLSKVEYKHWNERDLEIPFLLEFLFTHGDINTLLDVGAHYSWYHYAQQVNFLIPNYDGIDILPDEKTEAIVNKYWKKNVKELKGVSYDCVICISSIEHAGISTYRETDYTVEQQEVFQKILDLSKKYVVITFPYGKEAFHPGEFANITEQQLMKFISMGTAMKFQGEARFFFSEFSQGKMPYKELNMKEAGEVEYKQELGTRCVCLMTLEKV